MVFRAWGFRFLDLERRVWVRLCVWGVWDEDLRRGIYSVVGMERDGCIVYLSSIIVDGSDASEASPVPLDWDLISNTDPLDQ